MDVSSTTVDVVRIKGGCFRFIEGPWVCCFRFIEAFWVFTEDFFVSPDGFCIEGFFGTEDGIINNECADVKVGVGPSKSK